MVDSQHFTDAAADYSRLAPHLWDRIGADAVAAADPQPGERVLDACSGSGSSALPAAAAVGAGGQVDAVDLAGGLLDVLRQRAGERGLGQVRTHQADVLEFGQPGEYDLVQCVLGIMFFPDFTAGSRQLVNRLRPGGRLMLSVWDHGVMADIGMRAFSSIQRVRDEKLPDPAYAKSVLEDERRGGEGTAAHADDAGQKTELSFDQIDTQDAFGPWMEDLGLTDVSVTVQERSLELDDELAWLVITGSGFRSMFSGMSGEQVEEVRSGFLAGLDRDGFTSLNTSTLVGIGHRPE
ncbi:class I SAM-dependent methyltransferase [Brevibacterium luteolum]|uniref:class I SAM-dependent methyltransferase n=1 Tax=Brevibacterium luteolum TaxID=199591 RepID=UPI00223A6B70|nr:class I SAM-dependent methyltransferase [Brevibacterium luteolum]MCT1873449.1 class I SAM-dependent methyltransferase [Brevibacterium luteolum]MCT1890065.1 class I SAM-dependent methyltransferase [Brevibacterium luteolum]MCT1892490.1 class I SAM-dependent methyltransferase [Brevibacterium luteolum]MCT1923155.1 class I SAM-dependent methyltransferase [Brevibacterium luteolum]